MKAIHHSRFIDRELWEKCERPANLLGVFVQSGHVFCSLQALAETFRSTSHGFNLLIFPHHSRREKRSMPIPGRCRAVAASGGPKGEQPSNPRPCAGARLVGFS